MNNFLKFFYWHIKEVKPNLYVIRKFSWRSLLFLTPFIGWIGFIVMSMLEGELMLWTYVQDDGYTINKSFAKISNFDITYERWKSQVSPTKQKLSTILDPNEEFMIRKTLKTLEQD